MFDLFRNSPHDVANNSTFHSKLQNLKISEFLTPPSTLIRALKESLRTEGAVGEWVCGGCVWVCWEHVVVHEEEVGVGLS